MTAFYGYVGRFAPTPSRPLHFGSIVTALASYLDARFHDGRWFLRIDDVDTPRVKHDAERYILSQLSSLGLFWDGDIQYQHDQLSLYQQALERLKYENAIYACSCKRKQLGPPPYPGHCRDARLHFNQNYSIRVRVENNDITFDDRLQGQYVYSLPDSVGDFIVKRADGLFAYHLAMVINDAGLGVTHVVRGADLLDSTARQVYLQKRLGLSTPTYLHIPIVIDERGKKLGKSTQADIVNMTKPVDTLKHALRFLGQVLPDQADSIETILDFAIHHWQPDSILKQQTRFYSTN